MAEILKGLNEFSKQIHIPSTVLLDIQAIYPQHLVPEVLRDASEWYIAFSGDPLIRGAFYGGPEFNWFRAFLYLEAYAQQPKIPSSRETDSRS
jgi:hypothetical protein